MLFSVLGLLLVVAVVMKLSSTQLQAIKPAAAPGQPADAATRSVERLQRAVEQGAVQRAADAASQ